MLGIFWNACYVHEELIRFRLVGPERKKMQNEVLAKNKSLDEFLAKVSDVQISFCNIQAVG